LHHQLAGRQPEAQDDSTSCIGVLLEGLLIAIAIQQLRDVSFGHVRGRENT